MNTSYKKSKKLLNDEDGCIEFTKQATERLKEIESLIKEYIEEFDIVKFRITYDKIEDEEVKLKCVIEYNVIIPKI